MKWAVGVTLVGMLVYGLTAFVMIGPTLEFVFVFAGLVLLCTACGLIALLIIRAIDPPAP